MNITVIAVPAEQIADALANVSGFDGKVARSSRVISQSRREPFFYRTKRR